MMRRRWARVAVVIVVVAWPLAAWLAAAWLEDVGNCPSRVGTVVVLAGAGAYYERARWAARVYQSVHPDRVFLTNENLLGPWSDEDQRSLYFVERAERTLVQAGVPRSRIEILHPSVLSTYSEAILLARHARRYGISSLAVVTSGYHARRADWMFRRAFAGSQTRVYTCPVPTRVERLKSASWWLSRRGWVHVAPEFPKLLWYRVRY